MTSDDGGGGFFQDLGTFHIWVQLILLPLAFITLIGTFVYVARSKWTWVKSTARFVSAPDPCSMTGTTDLYACKVNVTVDGLPGDTFELHVPSNRPTIEPGSTWPVQYLTSEEQSTLTTDMTPQASTKKQVLWILGIFAALVLVIWVINFALRKNKTFKTVSGAMEGAELVHGAFNW